MTRKIILGIDPGETTGFAILRQDPDNTIHIGNLWSESFALNLPTAVFARTAHFTLHQVNPDQVFIEDYRIYASHAGLHIGSRIPTLELLVTIECILALTFEGREVPCTRVPAAKKDRWPLARLDAKFPNWRGYYSGLVAGQVHAFDALRVALAGLEMRSDAS